MIIQIAMIIVAIIWIIVEIRRAEENIIKELKRNKSQNH